MIKRMVFLKRRPDLSLAEFETYWSGSHMDVVRQLPRLRGLRLNVVQSWTPPEAAWDGIGEVWFDTLADAAAAYESEPFARTLAEDRARFATMEGQVCFVTERTIISPGGDP